MSRCHGSRFCEKGGETWCVDCGRALCRDHWTWTACGERGTHRHRACESEPRERVRTSPKGDGEAMPAVFREIARAGRKGPPRDEAKREKVRVLAAAGETNDAIRAATGASTTMISAVRKEHGLPGKPNRRCLPAEKKAALVADVRQHGTRNRKLIAERHGVPTWMITYVARQNGIPTCERVVPEWKLETIRQEWPKNTTCEAIGKIIGCDDSRVSQLAKRLGLPGRAKGRPRRSAA